MRFYDIYNGDADGICALLQLRLAEPRDATLVTGVKRDIRLLQKVDPAPKDRLTVLDISLDSNRAELALALDAGAEVQWFDHHHAGSIPRHPGLTARIDTDPAMCTSLIVDRYLAGRFRPWAIVAAFGDNLDTPARALARDAGLLPADTEALRELGVCINYNAYGESIADLRYTPEALYHRLRCYADPLEFVRRGEEFAVLRKASAEDISRAESFPVEALSPGCALVTLPNEVWSRRVIGIFANRLAQRFPDRAHAILVRRAKGYLVSLRAPLERPRGAVSVAATFSSGGGREGAAGIDHLPDADLARLIDAMKAAWPGQ
ncbi:MAG: acetyltransferase [Burkholderiales bacterium]